MFLVTPSHRHSSVPCHGFAGSIPRGTSSEPTGITLGGGLTNRTLRAGASASSAGSAFPVLSTTWRQSQNSPSRGALYSKKLSFCPHSISFLQFFPLSSETNSRNFSISSLLLGL